MNKVCHISTVHKKTDTRILYKECFSLRDAGFDVYFVVQNGNENENIDGVNIIGIPNIKNRFKRVLINNRNAVRAAISLSADLYHFHDPEFIRSAFKIKRKTGAVVIYDVHEDIIEQIKNKTYLKTKILKSIIAFFIKWNERKGNTRFDAIIPVTEKIAEKFDESKVQVIKNYSITSLIDPVKPYKNRDSAKKVVLYAGAIRESRAVWELIESIGQMNDETVLWLLGPWRSQEYKKKCETSSGWSRTIYFGNVPYKEVFSYVKSADIAVALAYPHGNSLYSLPNKFFEYMACGVPFITSNFPFRVNFLHGVAEFVDPKDSTSIAAMLEGLLKDKEKLEEMGNLGRKMVDEEFSWEAESAKLINLYRRLLQ